MKLAKVALNIFLLTPSLIISERNSHICVCFSILMSPNCISVVIKFSFCVNFE